MQSEIKKCVACVVAVLFFWVANISSVYGFTISEERELGEKLLYSVRSAFPLVDDPDITMYLTKLGQDVLEVAGIQYFDYHFFVVNSSEFNAFAAPSGLVFFYTGLISAMNSEEELLSVLAHEIGHVAKRHIAGRVEKGKIIGVASMAAALAALALGGGTATQALLTTSLAAGQSATLHFSRKDEEEADLMAYGWMQKLQRDPEGQAAMLRTMRRISRYRSEKLPQYLLTHPNPEDRLDYVEGLISGGEVAGGAFPAWDQFDFFRFKYRVMALTSDKSMFRAHLANIVSDSRSDVFSVTMAKYGMAQLERAENNTTRALSLLDEVIDVFPSQNILLTDKGAALYSAGKFREGIGVLEKAWRNDSTDLYAAYCLARCYFAVGEKGHAETLYKTVSYGLPEYSKIYFDLGKIAAENNKNSEASLYLGKYYFYEGKLKLASFSLKNAVKDGAVNSEVKAEAEKLLEQIKRLQEK